MKTSLKLLLLSTLTAMSGVGAGTDTNSGVYSLKCTPFYRAGINSKISFNVRASKMNKVIVTVDIVNDLYKDGITIYNKTYTAAGSANISYNNSYTRSSGNILRIKQGTSKRNKTIECEINVAKSSTIVIGDSIYNFESNSYYYSYSNSGWSKNKEKISFYNFEDCYMPAYYHQIDFSNFYIKLNETLNTSNISCENAVFGITNKNGIFNSFEHDSELAYFPLTFERKDSSFFLKLKNVLYVNPLTQEMSATQKTNFVKTRLIYLPKNEKRYEDEYNCYISLEGFGIDRADFLTNFKYKSLLNTFGDCRNSEYCIVNS